VRNFVAVGSWVSILWGVKIRHLPLTWLVAVNTVLALPRSLWSIFSRSFSFILENIANFDKFWKSNSTKWVILTIFKTNSYRASAQLCYTKAVGQSVRLSVCHTMALSQN